MYVHAHVVSPQRTHLFFPRASHPLSCNLSRFYCVDFLLLLDGFQALHRHFSRAVPVVRAARTAIPGKVGGMFATVCCWASGAPTCHINQCLLCCFYHRLNRSIHQTSSTSLAPAHLYLARRRPKFQNAVIRSSRFSGRSRAAWGA